MARYDFGGTLADFVVTSHRLGTLDTLALSAANLTMWSAQSGGTRYTDLVLNGSAVSSIVVGADGQVPKFQGPDGVTEMWADGGAGRVRTVTLQGAPGPVGPVGPTGPAGGGAGDLTVIDNGDGTSTVTSASGLTTIVDNGDGTSAVTSLGAAFVKATMIAGPGIDPTGATDSTVAIQSLIDAAGPRANLVFPAGGVFLVQRPSEFSPALSITTPCTITAPGGATLRAASGSAQGLRLIQVAADDVAVQGLTFDPNGVTATTGIYLTSSRRTLVTGNTFLSPQSGGVHVTSGVFDLKVHNNSFYGGGYGFLLNQPTTGGRYVVSNNTFDGLGLSGDGIEFNSPGTVTFDATITGNTVSNYAAPNGNVGFGIGVSWMSRVTVTGNVVRNCGRNGIHFDGQGAAGVVISGNVVSGCGHAGIEIQGESGFVYSNVTVAGNDVSGCCTAPSINLGRGGIELGSSITAAGSGFGVVAANVSGNNVHGNGAAGIYMIECRNSIVSGNTVHNNVGPGISMVTAVASLISGNRAFDTQATKTQTYGFVLGGGGGSDVQVIGNNFAGNLTGTVQDGTTGACYLANIGGSNALGFNGGGTPKLGFFGHAPVSQPAAVPAAATDATTTQALVNDMRTKLISMGLLV